jgi:hypothetical protein
MRDRAHLPKENETVRRPASSIHRRGEHARVADDPTDAARSNRCHRDVRENDLQMARAHAALIDAGVLDPTSSFHERSKLARVAAYHKMKQLISMNEAGWHVQELAGGPVGVFDDPSFIRQEIGKRGLIETR